MDEQLSVQASSTRGWYASTAFEGIQLELEKVVDEFVGLDLSSLKKEEAVVEGDVPSVDAVVGERGVDASKGNSGTLADQGRRCGAGL